MFFIDKFKKGIQKTKQAMSEGINNAFKIFKKIDEELYEELEEILILSDISAESSAFIIEELRKRVKEKRLTEADEVKQEIKAIIAEILSPDHTLKKENKPYIMILVGVNGAGKTTTAGKLAHQFSKEGKSVILAAADTFRAAATEQLEVWAQRSGADFFCGTPEQDPASVVYQAAEHLKKTGKDVLICDTAGRLQTKKGLMDELSKMHRILKQQTGAEFIESLLVVEAATGQNALLQAQSFSEAADLTGLILTKLDGTAKGGVIIPLVQKTGLPVKMVGVGEQLEDLMDFDPASYAEELFD
ncbi:MAG: signal recognition particle-docking protein FtsY [Clostridia bacterium]|nr:signal recognition particle-docking protein FtsY [Clostridia bacterium]